MIPIKTPEEIIIMREGGRRLADISALILEKIKPGITGLEIEKYADSLIKKSGGTASFKTVKGYKYATCICLNDIVVHGLPGHEPFKEGDLVGLDIGLFYQGLHTDMSWSIILGKSNKEVFNFLNTGKKAIREAIKQILPGNHVGDISQTIEKILTPEGFKPVKALVGHGVGKNLHEDPEIPCFQRGKIKNTPLIKQGMTFAVEVIYNEKDHRVVYKNKDGWTISTSKEDLSGLFELTVAVTENRPLVLTTSENFAKISGINASP